MGPAKTASRSAQRGAGHNHGRHDHQLRQIMHSACNDPDFSIIDDEDGAAHPRISAVNALDVEIAGAYQPQQRQYWLAYVTPLLAATAGVEFHPDHISLGSREEARQWVNLVAHLYAKAARCPEDCLC